MTVQDAYTNWSTTYDQDRNLTRDLDAAVTRETLSDLQGKAALETGCGTGKNTVFLAEQAQSVLALDFSEGMIGQARAKVRAENVTFTVADLTKPWPCPDQAVDVVVCNLVLEHIENLAFIFAEAARVLRPGGQFFVCELHPFRQYQGTKANFQRGEEAMEIPAFVHHLSEFTQAAGAQGYSVKSLREWWHAEDTGKPPRLVSFVFELPRH
jgi:ubiquinone/menaquinone biosynthesis C-methylase UbiE